MKKIAGILSVCIILWTVFYALTIIAKDNEFTSVRKYLKPQEATQTGATETWSTEVVQDTLPPVVMITNLTNNQVVTDESVDVQLEVTDNVSVLENITTKWGWIQELKMGYNPIVVSATDEAGNTGVSYIIVERK